MRRALTLLLPLTIVLGACGSDGDAAAPTTSGEATTTTAAAVTTTTAEPTTTTEATTTTTEAAPAGPPTVDELLASPRPLTIAHAGGARTGPHSTMYAYEEAVAAGADVLELDVQLTGDGVLIVQHDLTVDATTDGTGEVVDFTFAEISELDAAHWWSPECWPCRDRPVEEYVFRGVRTGVVIPPVGYTLDDFRIITFRELAEAFPEMPLDIEIKGELPQAGLVAEVLAAELRELGRTDSSIVVSFDSAVVARFQELAPEVATSPGIEELTAWYLEGAPLGDHAVIQVPPVFDGIEVITPDFLARAAEEGVPVWAWSDDPASQENAEFYRRMLDLGVQGYIVDFPAVMAEVVASR